LLMGAVTEREFWAPFFIAIGVGALLFGGFRARAFIACVVLSVLIASGVNGLLKSMVDRPRPKHVDEVRMVEVQSTRPAFLTLFKKPTIRFSDSSDRNRSRAIVSISAHDNQHRDCCLLHAVLSTLGLALLVHRRSYWLLAGLYRCALARRRDRRVLCRGCRSATAAQRIRGGLEKCNAQMDATALCAPPKFDW